MVVGILCEGGHDEIPLKIILTRILSEIHGRDTSDVVVETYSTEGSPTYEDINAGVVQLLSSGAEFLITFFDMDESQKKKKLIKKILTRALKGKMLPEDKVINIFFPGEFEEWLLLDEDNLKKILLLPANLPLGTSSGNEPKENVNMLIGNAFKAGKFSITETTGDVYERICHGMNFDHLMSDPMFRKLLNDTKSI